MSVSNSTDPVQTIIDILDNAAASEWSNAYGVPRFIERLEETEFSVKKNRSDPACYVWSSVDGDFSQMGAGYDAELDDQVVQVDVWDRDSATRAATIAGDVRSIAYNYATDNQSSTKWSEIAPQSESDIRAETATRRGNHYVLQEFIMLHAYREL